MLGWSYSSACDISNFATCTLSLHYNVASGSAGMETAVRLGFKCGCANRHNKVFDRWGAGVKRAPRGVEIKPFDPGSSSLSHIVARHLWFLNHSSHYITFMGSPGLLEADSVGFQSLCAGHFSPPLCEPTFWVWDPSSKRAERANKKKGVGEKKISSIELYDFAAFIKTRSTSINADTVLFFLWSDGLTVADSVFHVAVSLARVMMRASRGTVTISHQRWGRRW